MKRLGFLVALLALVLWLLVPSVQAQGGKKKKPPAKKIAITCPPVLNDINDYPDRGCGKSLDPLLNQQKNTTQGDPDTAENMTFTKFAKLAKIVQGYIGIGFPRDKLKEKGEGDMVRVVAWAIDSRPQKNKSGESCNCGFTGVNDPKNTDVHIVLVSTPTLKLKAKAGNGKTAAFNTLKKREDKSQTAEYSPRLRVARNEEFDGSKLKDLINPSKGGKLKVRVTGLLLYDSEHALGPFKLLRKTDWEIHPVFRLEFCPKDKTCLAASDDNWVDINK
jgi:hypothetical protein